MSIHPPFSKHALSRGLTILEMLVSSAMLAVIIVGLTAMFVQTQKAFKTGIKQTDVGDAGLTISRLIGDDLTQLSDGQGLATNPTPAIGSNQVVNLMWSWNTNYVQYQDGVAFRTNQLESLYMLVRTNSGWTGVGYAVSNMTGNLGVGTLYRYIAPINSHYFDNTFLYDPFLFAFTANFSNLAYADNPNIRLSRIADGVVHLKIRVYDSYGNPVGVETNLSGSAENGSFTNVFPAGYTYYKPPPPHSVTTDLPASIDLELGILEPDAWDHLKSLIGNPTAQAAYLSTAASKIDIFHQRIMVRAATLQ